MPDSSNSLTPRIEHRRPSPGEPREPVVVDADSGEELVVVPPRYAFMSRTKRRYHTPDADAHPTIAPECNVAHRCDDGWQYRRRSVAEAQADCCHYCAGDITREEISAKGSHGEGTLTHRLANMSVEEFDALTENSS